MSICRLSKTARSAGKVRQRVIATAGCLDQLQSKGGVETLIRSLARLSEKPLLVLSGNSNVNAHALRIGPALIFERLWHELGLPAIITGLLAGRKSAFDVEGDIFLTVLHRLMFSGSGRSCAEWRCNYRIAGVDDVALHHLYQAMAFLGKVLGDQSGDTLFTPRCTKDLLEEKLFARHRSLFSGLELVFFDTTSIYFEGEAARRPVSSVTAK